MEPATHIIGKQNIRVRYNGLGDPLALRQLVSDICSDELPVRLNKLLDRYDDPEYVLRIDKLDISLSLQDNGSLREKLATAIVEKVEAELRQKLEQRVRSMQPVALSLAKTLRFYLEKGYLPRHSGFSDARGFVIALEAALQSVPSTRAIVEEVTETLQHKSARSRLLWLTSDAGFSAFIEAADAQPAELWSTYERLREIFLPIADSSNAPVWKSADGVVVMSAIKDSILQALVGQLTKSAVSKRIGILIADLIAQDGRISMPEIVTAFGSGAVLDAIRTTLAAHAKQNRLQQQASDRAMSIAAPGVLNEPDGANAISTIPYSVEEGESIFIHNAGLVLLALYLPALFTNVGLLDTAGKPSDAVRAVTMLRYLAFADAPFLEMEVVLEKLLCGIPLSQSLELHYRLSEEERSAADGLLESAIEHWTVLKTTSPDGLRYNFLQRDGKLSYESGQWKLTVQRQAQDILLEYLPSNIGMIKLSWMPEMLIVKWQS